MKIEKMIQELKKINVDHGNIDIFIGEPKVSNPDYGTDDFIEFSAMNIVVVDQKNKFHSFGEEFYIGYLEKQDDFQLYFDKLNLKKGLAIW